jgi:hypothetical protein
MSGDTSRHYPSTYVAAAEADPPLPRGGLREDPHTGSPGIGG